MRKVIAMALLAMFAMNVSAAKKKAPQKKSNKPVFTVIKENPITSMKDQNRSGTCWDYSTLSFFESEILKLLARSMTSVRASLPTRLTWTVPFRWYATMVTVSLHRAVLPKTRWLS